MPLRHSACHAVCCTLQGFSQVMVWLSQADYAVFAVGYSASVVVLVSFLGLQLFTSVLCTTTIESKYVTGMPRCRCHRARVCCLYVFMTELCPGDWSGSS